MDKFNELFDIIEPNFKKGKYPCEWLWFGSYSGKEKSELKKPEPICNLHTIKNAVKDSIQKIGTTEEEVLEEIVSEGDYFRPILIMGHIDKMKDSVENEQKRYVMGLLSSLLVERLLRKNSGVLVLDDYSRIFGYRYHIAGKFAPLIQIPYYEALGTEYTQEIIFNNPEQLRKSWNLAERCDDPELFFCNPPEKGLIFQLDFPEDECFKFYPFYKCKNIKIFYCYASEPFLEESENCDSVKMDIDLYKETVKKITSGFTFEIGEQREIKKLMELKLTRSIKP